MPNEWISVKDGLPSQDELVLYCNSKKPKIEIYKIFVGKYLGGSYSDDVYAFLNIEKGIGNGATHWMPLPEPPNEV